MLSKPEKLVPKLPVVTAELPVSVSVSVPVPPDSVSFELKVEPTIETLSATLPPVIETFWAFVFDNVMVLPAAVEPSTLRPATFCALLKVKAEVNAFALYSSTRAETAVYDPPAPVRVILSVPVAVVTESKRIQLSQSHCRGRIARNKVKHLDGSNRGPCDIRAASKREHFRRTIPTSDDAGIGGGCQR